MKKYTFEVVIHEGSDEFWDSFQGKTGCDEVLDEIKQLLDHNCWFDSEVTLTKYEHN